MPPKKVSVRLMAPFSMHCSQCYHFIYKNTKFNARKSISGDKYLDISIVSFSIRCPHCSAEILFKTDPESGGYIIVKGASRNLDLTYDGKDEQAKAQLEEEAKAEQNPRNSDEPTSIDLHQAASDQSSHSKPSKSENAGAAGLPQSQDVETHVGRSKASAMLPVHNATRILPTPKRRKKVGIGSAQGVNE